MAVKISKTSFTKMVRAIMEGKQVGRFTSCCTECQHALTFMLQTEQVKEDESGIVRIVPKK